VRWGSSDCWATARRARPPRGLRPHRPALQLVVHGRLSVARRHRNRRSHDRVAGGRRAVRAGDSGRRSRLYGAGLRAMREPLQPLYSLFDTQIAPSGERLVFRARAAGDEASHDGTWSPDEELREVLQ